jgi:hypothetical protein
VFVVLSSGCSFWNYIHSHSSLVLCSFGLDQCPVPRESYRLLYRARHRNGRLLEAPRDGKYTVKVRGVFAQGWMSP